MATADDPGATAPAGESVPKELGLVDAMAYARQLQKEDRLEAADELYRRILAAAPDYPDAWHFRGVVAFQLGRLSEAETLIRRAVELAPAYSDAHNNLGNVLQHQKRTDEAVTCYERAIALQPDLADATTTSATRSSNRSATTKRSCSTSGPSRYDRRWPTPISISARRSRRSTSCNKR